MKFAETLVYLQMKELALSALRAAADSGDDNDEEETPPVEEQKDDDSLKMAAEVLRALLA